MITSGLVGALPFNEESGQARDLVGGNHGTLNNGVIQNVAGKSGITGYSFDGTDDYVNVPQPPVSGSAITISFWAKFGAGTTWAQMWGGPSGGSDCLIFHNDSNEYIQLKSGNGSSASTLSTANGTFPNGEWTHVTCVVNGTTQEIYKNGGLVKSGTSSYSFSGLTESSYDIGYQSGQTRYPHNGPICDFRIYQRSLSPREVRHLYREGAQALAPADGVSRYEFEGDVTDSWHANDGSNNGVSFESGYYGQAGRFNSGESDNITVSHDSSLNPQGDVTVSCWVNSDVVDGTNNLIAGKSSGSGSGTYKLYQRNTDTFTFFVGDSGSTSDADSGVTPATDTWYHVVGVVRNGVTEIWVDGTLQGTASQALGDSQGSFGIGYDPASSSQYFDGLIDDVRIYDRALRDWEIVALFEGYSDLVSPKSDGVAYYAFDDAVASGAIDSFGTNDGTINGASYVQGIRGKALSFDGSNDTVDTTDIFTEQATQYTVCAWVKPENDNCNILDADNGSGDRTQSIWRGVGGGGSEFNFIHVDGNDNTHQIDSSPVATGSWNFIAHTWDGSVQRAYLNAVPQGENSVGSVSDTSQNFIMGAHDTSGTNAFQGSLDDVRIYDYALSPAQVHDIYQWGTGGIDSRSDLL